MKLFSEFLKSGIIGAKNTLHSQLIHIIFSSAFGCSVFNSCFATSVILLKEARIVGEPSFLGFFIEVS